MITDEMLRRAAVISSDAFVRSIEERYGNEHVFSPGFEKKIRKLYLRANHPYLYRLMRQVASILLALLIGGGVWLTVDKEARAVFFGWVKEVYATMIWYFSDGSGDVSVERKEYHIPVIPEGYVEVFIDDRKDGRIMIYKNTDGQYLQFHYKYGADFTGIASFNKTAKHFEATVGVEEADLIISYDSSISSSIVWKMENGVVFQISGFLSAEELVALAESVDVIS